MNPGFVSMVVPTRKGTLWMGAGDRIVLGLHPYLSLLVVNTAGLRLLSLERLSPERWPLAATWKHACMETHR